MCTRDRYILEQKDIKDGEWREIGLYKTLNEIADKIDVSYQTAVNLYHGGAPRISRSFRITTIDRRKRKK